MDLQITKKREREREGGGFAYEYLSEAMRVVGDEFIEDEKSWIFDVWCEWRIACNHFKILISFFIFIFAMGHSRGI